MKITSSKRDRFNLYGALLGRTGKTGSAPGFAVVSLLLAIVIPIFLAGQALLNAEVVKPSPPDASAPTFTPSLPGAAPFSDPFAVPGQTQTSAPTQGPATGSIGHQTLPTEQTDQSAAYDRSTRLPVQRPATMPSPGYGVGRTGTYYNPSSQAAWPTPPTGSPGIGTAHPVYGRYGAYAQATAPAPASIGQGPSALRAATGAKPFANFTPRPAVSPYMNLYRADGTFNANNYYTLVKPMLEQQRMNQQFRNNIRGLQNTTRTQGSTLQQLDRRANQLQGTAQPRYFMNHRQYYPGLQR